MVVDHGCGIESIYIHMDELSPRLLEFAPIKGGSATVEVSVDEGEA